MTYLVGNWYVSNAAMTFATVLTTILVLFSDAAAYQHLFHVTGTDV